VTTGHTHEGDDWRGGATFLPLLKVPQKFGPMTYVSITLHEYHRSLSQWHKYHLTLVPLQHCLVPQQHLSHLKRRYDICSTCYKVPPWHLCHCSIIDGSRSQGATVPVIGVKSKICVDRSGGQEDVPLVVGWGRGLWVDWSRVQKDMPPVKGWEIDYLSMSSQDSNIF